MQLLFFLIFFLFEKVLISVNTYSICKYFDIWWNEESNVVCGKEVFDLLILQVFSLAEKEELGNFHCVYTLHSVR